MRLWRITPSAAPDDTRWHNSQMWREVVVRAETATEARVIASRMESDEMELSPRFSSGTQAKDYPSAFYDESLYSVTEIPAGASGQFSADGPREILLAHRTGTA